MSIEAWQAVGAVFGVLAVVISVLGLANGIRQNTRTLRTQNYTRALERLASIQSRLSADRSVAALLAKGLRDVGSLTPEERIQFSWIFYEMFGAFEFMLDQAQEAALPPEVWERWSATLAWWISLPGVIAWWKSTPTPFSDDFTKHVDDLIEHPKVDVAADERWRRFLQGPAQDQRAGSESVLRPPTEP